MWRDICGYEGYYQVNEYGIVKSLDRFVTRSDGVVYTKKSKIMSQNEDSDGYMTVKLNKDGVSKRIPVHRLVALEFVDGYKDGYEVNHIDCDRKNNYFKNLEWVSHVDNVAYTKMLKRHVSDRDLIGENNPNYGRRTLKERFSNEPNLRLTQSRPGAQNGRCRRVRLVGDVGEIDFDFLGQCAKYLIENGYSSAKCVDSVSTNIRLAAENNRKYLGLTFQLI